MRPQQQNRRMRGRNNSGGGNNNNNNNNRRGPNPLTRNYESNGPDVKIRGSAQQIAEKYATLARDAQSSGDRVMAENYLQHAEHYNRIIAAAQAQFASQQIQTTRDDLDDDLDEASYGFEGGVNGGETHAPAPQQAPAQQQQPQQQAQPVNGSGPQPIIEGVPAEVALNSEPAGQHSGGGRHRDRRRPHNNNAVNGNGAAAPRPEQATEEAQASAAEAAPAPAEQPQAAESLAAAVTETPEPQEKPRRGRRPRRAAADTAAPEGGDGEAAPAEG
ncbi:DUF4167 domain-containing protein [Mesorhizobium ephedrae]|uniref:DUF4167 domain-containing protein n=2 Tax=Kumtagia ephedrae TaxID=2116701 RepID=A0A2P7RMC6_9HYPH|nr:DUF4167 domain-containing protein [Mesorhizobium ephedrae]